MIYIDKAQSVFVIDIDGDGDLDIVTTSADDDELYWLENDGSQSFSKHEIDDTGGDLWYASAADLDFDGDIDIM